MATSSIQSKNKKSNFLHCSFLPPSQYPHSQYPSSFTESNWFFLPILKSIYLPQSPQSPTSNNLYNQVPFFPHPLMPSTSFKSILYLHWNALSKTLYLVKSLLFKAPEAFLALWRSKSLTSSTRPEMHFWSILFLCFIWHILSPTPSSPHCPHLDTLAFFHVLYLHFLLSGFSHVVHFSAFPHIPLFRRLFYVLHIFPPM